MLRRLARYGKSLATTLSAEGPTAVAPPLVMFRFQTAEDLERWHVSTDAYFGGRSRASLDLARSGASGGGGDAARAAAAAAQQTKTQPIIPFATFSGRCSTAPTLAQVEEQEREAREEEEEERKEAEAVALGRGSGRRRAGGDDDDDGTNAKKKKKKKKPPAIAHTSSNAEIARAGYAVAASKVLDLSNPFDLSPYSHLVCTVRGDGGRYLATVRTDSLSGGGGDVWQAPFSAPRGRWADVRLPLSAFALTHRGQLVGRRVALRADRVLSVGVSFAAAGQVEKGGGGEASDDDDERESEDDDDDKDSDAVAFRLDLKEIRAEAVEDDPSEAY